MLVRIHVAEPAGRQVFVKSSMHVKLKVRVCVSFIHALLESYQGSLSLMTVPGGSFLHFWQPALSHCAHTHIPRGLIKLASSFFFLGTTPFFALTPRTIYDHRQLIRVLEMVNSVEKLGRLIYAQTFCKPANFER
jgi:hypothetical protein